MSIPLCHSVLIRCYGNTRNVPLLASAGTQLPGLANFPAGADATRSRTIATPASAQASSFSPPGRPTNPEGGNDFLAALDRDAAGQG